MERRAALVSSSETCRPRHRDTGIVFFAPSRGSKCIGVELEGSTFGSRRWWLVFVIAGGVHTFVVVVLLLPCLLRWFKMSCLGTALVRFNPLALGYGELSFIAPPSSTSLVPGSTSSGELSMAPPLSSSSLVTNPHQLSYRRRHRVPALLAGSWMCHPRCCLRHFPLAVVGYTGVVRLSSFVDSIALWLHRLVGVLGVVVAPWNGNRGGVGADGGECYLYLIFSRGLRREEWEKTNHDFHRGSCSGHTS